MSWPLESSLPQTSGLMNVQCRRNLQPRMIGEIRSEGEKLPLYHAVRINKLSFCIDSGSPTVGSGEY